MKTGVSISNAEICLNVLGDLGVVGEDEEDMLPSAFDENMLFSPLERGHLRTKRCSSTPRCLSFLNAVFPQQISQDSRIVIAGKWWWTWINIIIMKCNVGKLIHTMNFQESRHCQVHKRSWFICTMISLTTFALDFNLLPMWWLNSISQGDLYIKNFCHYELVKCRKRFVNVAENSNEGEDCILPYLSSSLPSLTAHWSGTVGEIYICADLEKPRKLKKSLSLS